MRNSIHNLLRWSEKYTKTDMVYFASGAFWLSFASGVGAILSFGISILISEYISKEVFGIYRYILSLIGILSVFSLAGMGIAITRAVSQGYDGIFIRALYSQSAWSLLQVLFSLVIALYYFIQGNNVYGFAFLFVSILAPINSVLNTYASFLIGKRAFKEKATSTIVTSVLAFIIMGVAILWSPTVITLLIAYYGGTILGGIFFTWRTIKKYRSHTQDFREEDITYGKHLSVSSALGVFASQIDSVLVYHILGPVELALYTFATLIPDKIRNLSSSLSSIALPKLSSKTHATSTSVARDRFMRLSLVSAVLAGIYALSTPYIFSIFFSEYISIASLSALYGISLIAISGYYSTSLIQAEGDEKKMYAFSMLSAVLRLAIVIPGLMFFGLAGAIIGRMVAMNVQSILPLLMFKKKD